MKAAFQEKFLTQERDYWTDLLAAENTCVAPVLSIAEVVQDEHLLARKTFMNANHPAEGEFTQLAPVLAGCERQQPVHQVQAAGVTNTDEVLQAAGFSEADIARLKESGAVE
jgi:alpha-methylacyl-CoA racemase